MPQVSRDAVMTNSFVDSVYTRIGPIYDSVFGVTLQPGRVAAVRHMGYRPGTRVLEVGVGTGLNTSLYPRSFIVTGIDISSEMLQQARERVVRERLEHISLVQMDAAHLTFDDESFDVVYAPYTVSAVPDPVAVAREMRRVCRPGGMILVLNHFRSANPIGALLERAISPITPYIGFKSDLDLPTLLAEAHLNASSIEMVNFPPIWSLVTCIKE